MSKIGICGHFNFNAEAVGGQTIKTRIISETLKDIYNDSEVMTLDTAKWKKKAPVFFIQCIMLAFKSDHIIILPAQNGIKVLIPLFVLLARLLKRRLHYVVVGAWLADVLKDNPILLKQVKKIDYIYPQTKTLQRKLDELNIRDNTYVMPNFKKFNPIKLEDYIKFEKPYKVCMVSRINYLKGVESAINVVNRINEDYKEKVIELDIFGPVEKDYSERLYALVNKYNTFVYYKGIIDYDKIPEVIKDYFLLLFPTKYYTEGFPGTILDAFISGVPVLASRWESWQDIIDEGRTGFTYAFDDDEDFYNKLKYLINNPELVKGIKKYCLEESMESYSSQNAIRSLSELIK